LSNAVSAETTLEATQAQLDAFAADFAKMNGELQRAEQRARALEDEALHALWRALALCQPAVAEHGRRVSAYARVIAGWLDRPSHELHALALAGLVHDVGALAHADGLVALWREGGAAELPSVGAHPDAGAQALPQCDSLLLQTVRAAVAAHHERWDGEGYPLGLAREQIPRVARILTLADVYDTLRCPRPLGESLPHGRCVERVLASGVRFEPELLERFAERHEDLAELLGRPSPSAE
jgi:putative two-component system response regulator